ncbi:MAG: hypothetical protein J7647_28060 [Cyanobacteria bacterium SBLK]|nr:hypothetical protein [Cyanobacteria bacterium SBLK]
MDSAKSLTSTCRRCIFYAPQGRRGGTCRQLNVPVQGCWKACSLSAHPFDASEWKKWDANMLNLQPSLS